MKSKLLLLGMFLGVLTVFTYGQEDTLKTEDLLEMSFEDLLNMDVTTASKSAEKQSDAPGIISVLTRDEIERFGGTTLRDMLERVPGLISSGANYTNRTTIAPRGDQIKQNSSHVLFLINGRPVREVQEGGVSSDILETFPVNLIERIEVIKGPGSVLYGSDAFSGVVNIITTEPEKTTASVSLLGANGGGYGGSADVGLKFDDLTITVGGRYLEKTEWNAPYSFFATTYLAVPPFIETRDTSITLNIPNEGGGGFLKIGYKNLSFMSTYNQWTTAYVQGLTVGNTTLKKNFNNLGYNFKLSDKWLTDINVTLTNSKMDGENISKRDNYNLVTEVTNTYNISDKMRLVFGGLYNINDGTESGTSMTTMIDTAFSDGNISSFAIYAQYDYRIINSLKLILGLQANKVENIDLNMVPRAGLIWTPTDKISSKLIYSQAFRAPSINETNMNYMEVLKGDPNLKPEKVSTIDWGLSYQGNQGQVGVSIFWSKMRDNIQAMPDTGMLGLFGYKTYSNVGDITFMGAEFEGKYYVNKSLYLSGSFMYNFNENDSLENISTVANFGAKFGISYAWSKGITVSLFDIYQGDIDDRYTLNKNPYQGSYNLLHLNTNFNLNKLFSFSWKPEFSLFVNVDNLLDKPYYGYDLGGPTGDAIPSNPGRSVYFGFKASL